MSVQHFVDEQGRYDGKTLQELWPAVVDEVVRAVDPAEVILFGSVARGEDGPDSDIDLLVVFEHIEPAEKRPMMARIRSAIETFAPVDVIVTDAAEMASATTTSARSCTGRRARVARCIGGRVSKQSDLHEWLRFAHDDLAAARLLLTDVELPASHGLLPRAAGG